jgi:hypothetical protein
MPNVRRETGERVSLHYVPEAGRQMKKKLNQSGKTKTGKRQKRYKK